MATNLPVLPDVAVLSERPRIVVFAARHCDHTLGLLHLLSHPVASSSTTIHKALPQYLGYGPISEPLKEAVDSKKVRHETWQDLPENLEVPTQEGWKLRCIRTEGHALDHTTFLLIENGDKLRGVFTGDNVLGHGTAVFEDLAAYMATLKKILGVFSSLPSDGAVPLYPGHGDVVQDGKAKLEEYIAHRQMREDQIIAALKDGGALSSAKGMTSMDIVKVVYKDVPESLHLPAEGGVKQVLVKLEGERRVAREEKEEERWWIMDGKNEGRL
ncbi:MAG: hypothetical protein Q9159_002431 [Coniocarpon cinnabarinum]